MINNLYYCFCTTTQYSFIHDYRGVGEEVCVSVHECMYIRAGAMRVKDVQINGFRGKLLKYLNMCEMLSWGHFLVKVK